MGKVLASYLVKVTLRVVDDLEETEDDPNVPTNLALEEAIAEAIEDAFDDIQVSASSERTDK